MPSKRLDKIIADTGLYSRSEARALIKNGRVSADVQTVKNPAEQIDPEHSILMVDGAPLEYRRFTYLMMNKPIGCISSTADRSNKTVIDLLDAKYTKLGLFPAGRLDKDATGLLLLTNDGELAHKITSPSNRVGKRYLITIDGVVSEREIKAVSEGLVLKDGTKCLPAILEQKPAGVFVTVFEGKYHQVKRMMAALGKPVLALKRVSIGGLVLDEKLKPGEYCEISDEISLILDDKVSKRV